MTGNGGALLAWITWGTLVVACSPVAGMRGDAPPVQGQTAAGVVHAPGQTQGHFAVATAHPEATAAAIAALQSGGSAADALVAASLVLSVATPQSTGIGGGGFAVVVAPDGNARAWDFREKAPAATAVGDYLTPDGHLDAGRSQHHGLAIGVPGYVAGLWALHQKYGKRPWADDCAAAIKLAQSGVAVSPQLAGAIASLWPALNAEAKAVFGHDGRPLTAGAALVWPKLAATLQAIAAGGPPAFYGGAVAADIAAAAQAAGGKLTAADLAAYDVRELAPLRGEVFGHAAYTMPQPSAGGPQLLAMAQWLGPWQAKGPNLRAYSNDPGWTAHALAEAMRRSFLLRLAYSGDPAHPAEKLDDAYPPAVRQQMQLSFDGRRATKTAELPAPSALPKLETHQNTSHLSIVDGDGLAIASTHTVNMLLGSGIMAAASGVLLNNEMDDFSYTTTDANAYGLAGSVANLARPNARPVSSMTPLVLMQGPVVAPGHPWMIIGAPGGTRIVTAVLQVVFRVAYTGWQLDTAVATTRVHHQALPDVVFVESGADGDQIASQLIGLGHTVERRPPWCNVQAIVARPETDGAEQWFAVSDPRGEGLAAAR